MNISKGHIYIIFCHINPKIYYIGSTFNSLKQRWNTHKTHFKSKHYMSIHKYFDEYGIDNFSLKLLKSYDVYREHNKDVKHLRAYEQLWINKLRDCCNERKSFNILRKEQKKEWYNNNKEKIIEQKKEYCKENKEKLSEKQKEYNKKNKEQIAKKNKEWREKNKEKIKDYYIKRKEEKNKL